MESSWHLESCGGFVAVDKNRRHFKLAMLIVRCGGTEIPATLTVGVGMTR